MNKDLSLLKQLTSELLCQAEDCGDYLATSATLVPDDVEMLKRLETFCKEPKVWVVLEDEVVDGETNPHEAHIFLNYDDALKCYHGLQAIAERDFVGLRGWVTEPERRLFNGNKSYEIWTEQEPFTFCHYRLDLYLRVIE